MYVYMFPWIGLLQFLVLISSATMSCEFRSKQKLEGVFISLSMYPRFITVYNHEFTKCLLLSFMDSDIDMIWRCIEQSSYV